jgi:hypothetical protein
MIILKAPREASAAKTQGGISTEISPCKRHWPLQFFEETRFPNAFFANDALKPSSSF